MSSLPNKSLEPTPVTKARFVGVICGAAQLNRWTAMQSGRMRIVDQILGWCLVLLGCVHNFVAAPLTYNRLSTSALWFVSAGLALWYAGFINLLRAYAAEPTRLLRTVCILTNLSMLAFVLAYAAVRGNWAAPEALALIVTVAALTVFSAVAGAARHRAS